MLKSVLHCQIVLNKSKTKQNNGNSPLLIQAAKEVDSFYKKTTDHLDGLDSNMQRYLDLSVQTVTEVWEGDLDSIIEQQTAQMDKHIKVVEDIKINNIETFRQI